MPNDADTIMPGTMRFFRQLLFDTDLPNNFMVGPASETLGFSTGGSAGDWINTQLGIPAAEVEIGTWDEISLKDWMPMSNKMSLKLTK